MFLWGYFAVILDCSNIIGSDYRNTPFTAQSQQSNETHATAFFDIFNSKRSYDDLVSLIKLK